MRSLRFALAVCALASVPAHAQAPRQDSITLCFERQEVRPWRTLDGGGLNFELLTEVARRAKVTFDYQSMPWKRCLEQLRANQVGGAFAVSFNRDRLGLGAYPGVSVGGSVSGAGAGGPQADPAKRMHIDTYVLVRRRGSTLDWDGKSFRNLEGRIGFQLGYSVGDFLRIQGVAVDEGSQRPDELAQKLIAGRVAGAAMGGGDATRMLRGPLGDKLELLPIPLVEKPYYLVLSHAFVAANPQLAARIWETIEQVRSSPGYRQRERDYLEAGRRKLVDTGVDSVARSGGRH